MDGNKLVRVMQEIAKTSNSNGVDLVFGQVISIDPLQIKIDNRFIIDKQFLILSESCQDKSIIVKIGGEDVIINIWEGLKIDDQVRMLRVHSGQTFYVMEKEESDI